MTITIETIVARWTGPERPKLWKGKLISGDGSPNNPVCRCAQGDVLHVAGWSDRELRSIDQYAADKKVAELLGISRAHAALLRHENDSKKGCPEDVLRAPGKILGPTAPTLLAFWHHLDRMTEKDRDAARAAAWDAARAAAWDAARAAAGDAAWVAARVAARAAAEAAAWADAARAAAWASSEIQGAAVMRERGVPFFFLPLFGFADPEAVMAAEVSK